MSSVLFNNFLFTKGTIMLLGERETAILVHNILDFNNDSDAVCITKHLPENEHEAETFFDMELAFYGDECKDEIASFREDD